VVVCILIRKNKTVPSLAERLNCVKQAPGHSKAQN